jgi:hypothetical protein
VNVYGFVYNPPTGWVDHLGREPISTGVAVATGAYGIGFGIGTLIGKGLDALDEIFDDDDELKDFIEDPCDEEKRRKYLEGYQDKVDKVKEFANAGAGVAGTGMQGPASVPTTKPEVVAAAGTAAMGATVGKPPSPQK